jgi:lipopolysaccharide transport system ATP-binding protein
LRGRVASLLEVGTGFHPELTGRENIYLNGAILGMRRDEIRAKFDEIVAFAEIERFLDTPVKRYSSGMYVRLAFAVAAHLEPEILIVDEVLAVGDAQFQKKCLGKMQDVATGGRTVLFVSHNMATLQSLCLRGILLSQGSVMADSSMTKTIRDFMGATRLGVSNFTPVSYRHRGDMIRVTNVQLLVDEMPTATLMSGYPCKFRVSYECLLPEAVGRELSVSIMIYNESSKLVNLWTNYRQGSGEVIGSRGEIVCHIDQWPFRQFLARVEIYTHVGQNVQDWIEDCLVFDSIDGDYYGSGFTTHAGQGQLFINHTWSSHLCQ